MRRSTRPYWRVGTGTGRKRARQGAFVIALVFLLSVAVPPGVVQPGSSLPLSGLWTWLTSTRAWAASLTWAQADPAGPVWDRAARAAHYVSSPRPVDTSETVAGLLPSGVPQRRLGQGSMTSAKVGNFDPANSDRVAAKSDETSDYFVNSDGSITRVFSTGRTNYRAPDGTWQPINTTLVAEGNRLRVKANDVRVIVAGPAANRRPAGSGVFAGEVGVAQVGSWSELGRVRLPGGEELGFDLAGARRVLPEVSGSTALYRGVLPDTDVELVAGPEGIKETTILRSPQAPRSWVFPLDLVGLTPRTEADG